MLRTEILKDFVFNVTDQCEYVFILVSFSFD